MTRPDCQEPTKKSLLANLLSDVVFTETHALHLQHLYVYAVLVFEAMATFVGQVSVLSLIALFGAATTAMVSQRSTLTQHTHNDAPICTQLDHDPLLDWILQVTTARKAVTLLLSYLIFTKPLTEQHATGLLLITMGIVIKLLPENKEERGPRRLPRKVERSDDGNKLRESREAEEERETLV